jgi:hypothetical protein
MPKSLDIGAAGATRASAARAAPDGTARNTTARIAALKNVDRMAEVPADINPIRYDRYHAPTVDAVSDSRSERLERLSRPRAALFSGLVGFVPR